MRPEDAKYLLETALSLEEQAREVEASDLPEGWRFLRINQTAAREMAARLKEIAYANVS